jgi:hypothetical protein
LVAFGGLIDTLRAQVQASSMYADLIRAQMPRIFQDIIHVYDPQSEQSFIVNIRALQRQSRPILDDCASDWPCLISLEDPPTTVRLFFPSTLCTYPEAISSLRQAPSLPAATPRDHRRPRLDGIHGTISFNNYSAVRPHTRRPRPSRRLSPRVPGRIPARLGRADHLPQRGAAGCV